MKRHHLFEFGDQPWLRGWARECYLDCLNHGLRSGGQFRGVLDPLMRWAHDTDPEGILDLGSGGAGPVETLLAEAQRRGIVLPRIVLSDLFPSTAHYQALEHRYGSSRIGFVDQPVSASVVLPGTPGRRMICSAFHHFKPDQAQAIVEDAARHASGLLIIEPLQRNWRHLFLVLLSGPFAYMGAPFGATRKTWSKFVFCTLLPVFPLMVMFDGCISVLRMYKPDEILQMFPPDCRAAFTFERGAAPYMRVFGTTYVSARRRPQSDS